MATGHLIDKGTGAKWRVGLSVPTDSRSSANGGIVNPRLWGHSLAIYQADSITPSEVVTGPPTQHVPSVRVPVIVLGSPHLALHRNGALLLLGHSYSSGPKSISYLRRRLGDIPRNTACTVSSNRHPFLGLGVPGPCFVLLSNTGRAHSL